MCKTKLYITLLTNHILDNPHCRLKNKSEFGSNYIIFEGKNEHGQQCNVKIRISDHIAGERVYMGNLFTEQEGDINVIINENIFVISINGIPYIKNSLADTKTFFDNYFTLSDSYIKFARRSIPVQSAKLKFKYKQDIKDTENKYKNEIKKLNKTIEDKNKELKSAGNSANTINREVNRKTKVYREQITKLNENIVSCRKTISRKDKKITELMQQNEVMTDDIADIIDAMQKPDVLGDYIAKTEVRQNTIVKYSNMILELQEQVRRLQQRLDDTEYENKLMHYAFD